MREGDCEMWTAIDCVSGVYSDRLYFNVNPSLCGSLLQRILPGDSSHALGACHNGDEKINSSAPGKPMPTEWKREKNWKNLYLRSEKPARARQLGFDYPRFQNMLLQEVRAAARKLP